MEGDKRGSGRGNSCPLFGVRVLSGKLYDKSWWMVRIYLYSVNRKFPLNYQPSPRELISGTWPSKLPFPFPFQPKFPLPQNKQKVCELVPPNSHLLLSIIPNQACHIVNRAMRATVKHKVECTVAILIFFLLMIPRKYPSILSIGVTRFWRFQKNVY